MTNPVSIPSGHSNKLKKETGFDRIEGRKVSVTRDYLGSLGFEDRTVNGVFLGWTLLMEL